MERINEFQATLIVTYGVDDHTMNIDTLTATVNFLTNIFYRINEIMSPEDRSSFVIEAISPGSFSVKFKEISKKAFEAVAFTILGGFAWEIVHPSTPVTPKPPVVVVGNKVQLEIQGNTYVMPIDSLAKYEAVRKDRYINGQLIETFSKLKNDERIKYLTFSPSDKPGTEIYIQRKDFDKLTKTIDQIQEDWYYTDELLEILAITKAGKYYDGQFRWKGNVINIKFDDNVIKHKAANYREKLQPGNIINVHLKEIKTNDYYTTQLIHSSFEIVDLYL